MSEKSNQVLSFGLPLIRQIQPILAGNTKCPVMPQKSVRWVCTSMGTKKMA